MQKEKEFFLQQISFLFFHNFPDKFQKCSILFFKSTFLNVLLWCFTQFYILLESLYTFWSIALENVLLQCMFRMWCRVVFVNFKLMIKTKHLKHLKFSSVSSSDYKLVARCFLCKKNNLKKQFFFFFFPPSDFLLWSKKSVKQGIKLVWP